MPQYQNKPRDLPDETVGKPWLGEHQQTVVHFCPRCGRVTTNTDKCDNCKKDDPQIEIENVNAE